jgi:hypothetical protein
METEETKREQTTPGELHTGHRLNDSNFNTKVREV